MNVSLQMPKPEARGQKPDVRHRVAVLVQENFGVAVDATKLRAVNVTPLLNRSAVRNFLLEFARSARPFNKFNRVSEETLLSVNNGVRMYCQNHVRRMPSKGRTL